MLLELYTHHCPACGESFKVPGLTEHAPYGMQWMRSDDGVETVVVDLLENPVYDAIREYAEQAPLAGGFCSTGPRRVPPAA